MTRHRFAPITCVLLAVAACTVDPGDPYTSLTTAASLATTNSSIDSGESGDMDGDTSTGDGDGDPTTGDGDGDGDPTTGDGDGDGEPGDGDGDTTGDGDGDGDLPANCGWNAGGDPAGYYCGFMGVDPGGAPIACPGGLVEGGMCGEVTGVGCCDANGDNWYCGDDGMTQFLVLEACG